jgi:predicted NACHT family NTPase
MKLSVDLFLAENEKLQHFLHWLNQQSLSVQFSYKPAAVRRLYLALALALDLDLDLDLAFYHARSLDIDLDRDLNLDRARALDFDLDLDLALYRALARASALYRALARAKNPDLKLQLQDMFDRLPDTSQENQANFHKWWQTNGTQWTKDLREIMIVHRNIGHDWQFTPEQKQLLQKYYDANLLLVECLNSDCYISRPIRQEIEDTLLLPIAEIEKRKTQ